MRRPSIPTLLVLFLLATPLAAQWEVQEVVDDSTGERTRFAAAEAIEAGYEGSDRPYMVLQCDADGATFYFETGGTFLDTGGRSLPVRFRVDDGEPETLAFRTTSLGTGAYRSCCDDVSDDELSAFAWLLSDMQRGAILELQVHDLQGRLHGVLFPLTGADSAIDALPCFSRALAQLDTPLDDAEGIASGGPNWTPMTVRPQLLNKEEVSRVMVRDYPPVLRTSGVGGRVRAAYFVDEDGRVQDARVSASSGHAQLDRAALALGEVMRFSPAWNRDKKVAVWIELTLSFESR